MTVPIDLAVALDEVVAGGGSGVGGLAAAMPA